MKRQIVAIMAAISLVSYVSPISVYATEKNSSDAYNLCIEVESEHPPLSEDTKIAIAAYKKNQTEENKQAVLDALNKAYDIVIDRKQKNLSEDIQNRDRSINSWLKTIILGKMPPFMSISESDNKMAERQAVADATNTYWAKRSAENRELVKQTLTTYYDAYLTEQQVHIDETIALRDSRIATSLEYFTSDRFQPQNNTSKDNLTKEDVLAEIICSYISVGAEIVPVNPEARVREREFNAAITNAQTNYLDNPTNENMSKLYEELSKAFDIAYSIRVAETTEAVNKGHNGADTLFNRLLDPNFISQQYTELTEQRNLYGRIDRMVTYGSNTYDSWTPRMKDDSRELATLLFEYQVSPTDENKLAAKTKFYELYDNMLTVQEIHLNFIHTEFESQINEIINQLVG